MMASFSFPDCLLNVLNWFETCEVFIFGHFGMQVIKHESLLCLLQWQQNTEFTCPQCSVTSPGSKQKKTPYLDNDVIIKCRQNIIQ